MFSSNETCELTIRSIENYNMSNWQITHTVDTLTTVNNKFDVLNKVNDLIINGTHKKDIFITDKSFLISTNYKTYFDKGNILKCDSYSITKVANIGKIITMEYNEEIAKINSLFAYYKSVNSMVNRGLKCRIRGNILADSYKILFDKKLDEAYLELSKGAKQQVSDVYERFLNPDINAMNKLLNRIENEKNKAIEKNLNHYTKIGLESAKRFEQCFNRFDRPILGVYHEDNHTFEILNADQMYKNGEESANRIKLKSITKNSPVVLALLVTGAMLGFVKYLAYRDHKVNNAFIEEHMTEMPQTTRELVENVYSNVDGEINRSGENSQLDPQVANLAESNFCKLEIVTNNRRVSLEITGKS